MPTVNKDVYVSYYKKSRNWGTLWGDSGISYSSYMQKMGSPYYSMRQTETNKDWKWKIGKRLDASTPYYRIEMEIHPAMHEVSGVYAHPTYGDVNFYDICNRSGLLAQWDPGTEDSGLKDLALAKLKRRLANTTQSYQALTPTVEMRELRQSVKGLTELTSKTVKALLDVKKGRLKDAYKKASDIWLLYSFGAKPLMADIQNANEAITAWLTRTDRIDRLTGTAKKSWKSHKMDNATTGTSGCTVRQDMEAVHTLSYKYICSHRFIVDSANDYGALNHFGLTPAALIPAAWELTAFSWVVDYFTTVGDLLEDYFTAQSGSSIYVVLNRKYTVESHCFCSHIKQFPTYPYKKWNMKPGSATARMMAFQRSSLASLPSRILRFKSLDEIGVHGVTKLLNLTAVLAQRR